MEDVLYMNFCNDVSFGIEDKVMVFGELQTALIVESGEIREVMHAALLLGYGASAINPYMAIDH